MTERTVITCDKCNEEVGPKQKYVNASVYGADIHEACITEMSATDLIVMLGLDDIKVMVPGNWQDSVKANSYYRRMRNVG